MKRSTHRTPGRATARMVALGLALAVMAPASAHAATYKLVGTGRVELPSMGGFGPWVDLAEWGQRGCTPNKWEGQFAMLMDVSAYKGKWLEFRHKSVDQVMSGGLRMEIQEFERCSSTILFGSYGAGALGTIHSWNAAKHKIKVSPRTKWLWVYIGSYARGVTFTVHECTSAPNC